MAYKAIQRVSVPNYKLFESMETKLMGQRIWRIFYYVMWENELVDIRLPTNMAASMETYRDFPNFEHL